ncbi:type III secretion system export apparatus subunit SctR [Stigmatella aurantiaca]|uniref:Type III secretion apparatus protein, YscR/HrcR family n=2 Tax=Stigmatella aurantiaca (strain DW4/3-1) TaxID=378806 RepID=Q08R97_STIAD|nr:type III secretion system export apparatus subunit SctR [Stigmatella aurantiaca]EAU63011.1 type III secretion apparatus protein, YscR/HrcR family [Stigmatella aurantiaca DW4/3-1]
MTRFCLAAVWVLPGWAAAGGETLAQASQAGNPLTMMAVLAVLSLLPFAVVMLTSFSKIAVVLSLARSAMGTQQAPPTVVLTGLAAVLSAHIMSPVMARMYEVGREAARDAESGAQILAAVERTAEPLRAFLVKHGSAEERSRFVELARELRPPEEATQVQEGDLFVVVPAFVITELKEAFQMGFLLFLPFLVLDMVIANILLALGMQSLSPSQVSLPFKILLFVTVDGWPLLAQGLIQGYR